MKSPSDSALSRVVAERTRELMGLGPPVQLVESFVAQHRLAMDGVLKSFERRLQMLYACLKHRDGGYWHRCFYDRLAGDDSGRIHGDQ